MRALTDILIKSVSLRRIYECLIQYHFFFFNDTATTEIYTLSLHDALPIARGSPPSAPRCAASPPPSSRPGSGALQHAREMGGRQRHHGEPRDAHELGGLKHGVDAEVGERDGRGERADGLQVHHDTLRLAELGIGVGAARHLGE